LAERFASILFDVAADPWVLKVPGVAIDGTISYNISAVAAQPLTTTAVKRYLNGVGPNVAGEAITVLIPLQLQSGSTVRAFAIGGSRTHAGAAVTAKLWSVDEDTPTEVAAVSLSGTTGYQTASSGVLTEFVSSHKSYYIEATIDSDASGEETAQLHYVRVVEKLSGTP
jgi:hypothetical protein